MKKQSDVQAGCQLLNLTGCRILAGPDGFRVAIWKDLDGPEVRQAIENVHGREIAEAAIYLGDPAVPASYKVRQSPLRHPGESFQLWRRRAEAMRNKNKNAA